MKHYPTKSKSDLEAMREEARKNPGGYVYEIDWRYPDWQAVPPEAIKGTWKVDDTGKLTDQYEENLNYRAVKIAKRPPPQYLLDTTANPLPGGITDNGQWMMEIDPNYGDLYPNIPAEGFTGAWYVGEDGRYTGQFRPNPLYKGTMET